MTKKTAAENNYLNKIPTRAAHIVWKEENGFITLCIQNGGWANRIAQVFFRRPKVSYVHLDEIGSYLWSLLDGEKNLIALGELVQQRFGEKAHPLYARLAKYFQILDSYRFIAWKASDKK